MSHCEVPCSVHRKNTGADDHHQYQHYNKYAHVKHRSYDGGDSRQAQRQRIPQHSDYIPRPPLTAPGSFGSPVLHDIYENSARTSDPTLPLACSLPGDIHLLNEEDSRVASKSVRYFIDSRAAFKPKSAKSRRAKKVRDIEAHRSKSLTQIDCLDSPPMVGRDGARQVEATSTFYPVAAPDDASRTPFRQKAPSQEYFSVTFDFLDDPVSELVPAVSGVLLRDALQVALQKRGLDVDSVLVYPPSSSTPLSLHFDSYRLAGCNLHVRAKDEVAGASISRANSTGSVPSVNGSRFQSTIRSNSATSIRNDKREKKPLSASQKGGRKNAMVPADDPLILRKSGYIFSNFTKTDKDKMEMLTDHLNQYSAAGIPPLPSVLTFLTPNSDSESDPFHLEDHWSNLQRDAEVHSKRICNQQDAIWELLHTEVSYIKTLKVIIDVFLSCLCNLQSGGILNDIDTEKMFSNITDIYAANHLFWVDYLLPMLFTARNHNQLLNPLHLSEGFLKFEQIFQPYIKYCISLNGCIHYVKDNHKNNELFKTYLAWCETQKDCEKLRLVDLLVKPMQRLTKYSLLLTAIHKKTDDEHTKAALLEMNEKLNTFVCGVDTTLRQRHEQERLSSIIGRIESYDAIETSNDEVEKILKEYCMLDLTCPMPSCGNRQSRQLLMEGSGLKLRESTSSKVDVHCFLFTDMLLICKPQGKKVDKVRVIRQPYVVDRLVVQEMASGGLLLVYLNEYRVATAAFALYTSDFKLWLEKIKKAQDLYVEAKSAAASERQSLGFLRAPAEEEEDYDFPSTALLVARSPRSSSRSSLVHSHSGSVDMSDPASTASNSAAPTGSSPVLQPPQTKAVSIELGDLRNSSLSSDEGVGHDFKVRSSSVETRVSVTVTSPRPEGMVSTSEETGTTVIQVPVISPPAGNLSPSARLSPRALQRTAPISAKPPLVKTKNVSPTQQEEPLDEEEASRRLNAKRTCRTERRYHTADSIDNLRKKEDRDAAIHKRLSWNCGQPSGLGPSERLLSRNKQACKCLSSDSVYSSSGVSSTGSVHLSGCSGESSTDDILIDVSEVKEGISSVQIKVNGGHDDIRRLKRFLLSSRSVEASDV